MPQQVSPLFSDTVALLAPAPARWWMQDWLSAHHFQPDTRLNPAPPAPLRHDDAHPAAVEDGEAPETIRHSTLISYFPSAAETFDAVTPTLLETMDDSPLWVQCTPMHTSAAFAAAERSRRAGVTYCHAPLLAPPEDGRRPRCLLYEPDRPPGTVYLEQPNGRDRVLAVMDALSSHITRKGALYFRQLGEHDRPPRPTGTSLDLPPQHATAARGGDADGGNRL